MVWVWVYIFCYLWVIEFFMFEVYNIIIYFDEFFYKIFLIFLFCFYCRVIDILGFFIWLSNMYIFKCFVKEIKCVYLVVNKFKVKVFNYN